MQGMLEWMKKKISIARFQFLPRKIERQYVSPLPKNIIQLWRLKLYHFEETI